MAEDKKTEFTLEDVSKHTTTESCWLVIGNASTGEYEETQFPSEGEFVHVVVDMAMCSTKQYFN